VTNHRRREAVQPTSRTTTRQVSTNQSSCLYRDGQLPYPAAQKPSGPLTVSLAIQNLRSQVLGCPTERVGHVRILHVQLTQPEITKSDMSGIIEKYILRFQVPKGARVSSIAKTRYYAYRYTTSRSWRCSRANNSSAL